MSKEFLARFLINIQFKYMTKHPHQSHHMFILSNSNFPTDSLSMSDSLSPAQLKPQLTCAHWWRQHSGPKVQNYILSFPHFFPEICGEIISSTSCRCRGKNSTRLHHAHSNDYEIKYIPIGITTWRFFAAVGSKIQETLHMDRAKQVVFARIGHFP